MIETSFLGTDRWDDTTIFSVLDRAAKLKSGTIDESTGLAGRVLLMVFFDPSLRTRTSFEVAMMKHGGGSVCLEPGRSAWPIEVRENVVMDEGAAEHLIEAAQVLSRYGDAIAVRAFPKAESWQEARDDHVLEGFARHATVPVINLESARRHPCQGLADALTIQERLGKKPTGKKFVLSWAWHPKALPTAVPVSSAMAAARLGMQVTVAHPPGFDLDPDDMAAITACAHRNGGSVDVNHDLDDAIAGKDVVYAKSWGRLDLLGNGEAEAEFRAPYRDWCITEKHMQSTHEGAAPFMHCLPVRRNVVVNDGVLDGPWSVVADQAENRLHTQRALLLEMLGENNA
jgi:N-acetylornithine carbamoyltransferase